MAQRRADEDVDARSQRRRAHEKAWGRFWVIAILGGIPSLFLLMLIHYWRPDTILSRQEYEFSERKFQEEESNKANIADFMCRDLERPQRWSCEQWVDEINAAVDKEFARAEEKLTR